MVARARRSAASSDRWGCEYGHLGLLPLTEPFQEQNERQSNRPVISKKKFTVLLRQPSPKAPHWSITWEIYRGRAPDGGPGGELQQIPQDTRGGGVGSRGNLV
jgi:hypothetical protein